MVRLGADDPELAAEVLAQWGDGEQEEPARPYVETTLALALIPVALFVAGALARVSWLLVRQGWRWL